MNSFTTTKGSRQVVSFRNGPGYNWSSRLYLNNGETAGFQNASHKTEKGARKWAEKVLAA